MEFRNDTEDAIQIGVRSNKISSISDYSLPSNYHEGELRIHNRINNTAIGIIIASFATIISAFIYMIVTKDIQIGGITTIAGTISEIISGVLFWYVTKASDDKWKYFNALNEEEEEKRLLSEIESLSNEKFKEKMIEKMVNTYCENKKQGK